MKERFIEFFIGFTGKVVKQINNYARNNNLTIIQVVPLDYDCNNELWVFAVFEKNN